MNALFVTSVEPHSGKTAVCLALGKQLQARGKVVGYLKPMSTQPWRTPQGSLGDEDTGFVRRALGLEIPESPVIVTSETLHERLRGGYQGMLLDQIKAAAENAAREVDLLLLEGGASLREGYAMGLSNVRLAEALGAPVLALVRCHNEMQIVDDALAARFRLGDQLLGVILNHVPDRTSEFLEEIARPYLEKEGVRVLGALPQRPRLSALSVGELKELLEAEVLSETYDPEALIETFTVGAMTAEAALARFRRQKNKAVITGGDRSDIQLAALETSTAALILTGNLQPSPLIIQQADSLGIPVLLVQSATMETVNRIEQVSSRTRLGQPEKLETFMKLMGDHVDTEAIFGALGLS
ncbi:MAG: phosphotransacetylase family protein [Anaerolineales bacterium]